MRCCITTANEDETICVGESLGALLRGGDIILLDGDLGAGKTHFSKGVAHGLGVKYELTSPTFNLVLEYPLEVSSSATFLRHFDLYRLEQEEELDDIDYFGLIEDEQAISLVEWGSKFAAALPVGYLEIALLHNEGTPLQREICMQAYGRRSEELLQQFAQLKGLTLYE